MNKTKMEISMKKFATVGRRIKICVDPHSIEIFCENFFPGEF
jgi:hypothetical protein